MSHWTALQRPTRLRTLVVLNSSHSVRCSQTPRPAATPRRVFQTSYCTCMHAHAAVVKHVSPFLVPTPRQVPARSRACRSYQYCARQQCSATCSRGSEPPYRCTTFDQKFADSLLWSNMWHKADVPGAYSCCHLAHCLPWPCHPVDHD